MTTKVKEFNPIIEGINANTFPQDKKSGLRIYLHSEKFDEFEKFFTASCPGLIRNYSVIFNLSLAYYEGCESVFILSMDNRVETQFISAKLPLNGYGQHLYCDFSLASHHIATQFCKLNGMRICSEISHWPILQYVLEKK